MKVLRVALDDDTVRALQRIAAGTNRDVFEQAEHALAEYCRQWDRQQLENAGQMAFRV